MTSYLFLTNEAVTNTLKYGLGNYHFIPEIRVCVLKDAKLNLTYSIEYEHKEGLIR